MILKTAVSRLRTPQPCDETSVGPECHRGPAGEDYNCSAVAISAHKIRSFNMLQRMLECPTAVFRMIGKTGIFGGFIARRLHVKSLARDRLEPFCKIAFVGRTQSSVPATLAWASPLLSKLDSQDGQFGQHAGRVPVDRALVAGPKGPLDSVSGAIRAAPAGVHCRAR